MLYPSQIVPHACIFPGDNNVVVVIYAEGLYVIYDSVWGRVMKCLS